MTATERAALRQLYNFCCGYCGVSETDVGAVLTTDHFQPTSRGGADAAANWVYCSRFNARKATIGSLIRCNVFCIPSTTTSVSISWNRKTARCWA